MGYQIGKENLTNWGYHIGQEYCNSLIRYEFRRHLNSEHPNQSGPDDGQHALVVHAQQKKQQH
jgi:hypothetical protein